MNSPRLISYFFDTQLRKATIYPTFRFVYCFADLEPHPYNDEKAFAIPVNWRGRLLEDPALDMIRRDPEFEDVFFIDEGRGWLVIPVRLFVLLCQALEAIAAADVKQRLLAPPPKKAMRYMKRKKV